MAKHILIISLSFCYILSQCSTSAKILELCEAAREVKRSSIANTWINSFVCLMKSESQFNTSKITGPGYKSSFSHGVLQINSYEWCNRYRPGGFCNKKCDAYLDNNIQDDLQCAKLIFEKVGFKHWKTFEKSCKNPSKLPDTSKCFKKDGTDDEEIQEEMDLGTLELEHPQYAQAEDFLFDRDIQMRKETNEGMSFVEILKNLRH